MLDTPLVSICSITYNHEPYIRQCLDGFMMQKTNFPFEVIIHDDASTDKTADIIREYEAKYPDIVKPIYQKENQYSKGVEICGTYVYPKARGKYIAVCEGDDYWTDPYKLQKQVDFLEGHPEYGLVRTNIHRYFQESQYLEEDFFSTGERLRIKDTFKDYIYHAWFAAPCTWLFRRVYLKDFCAFDEKDCFKGDIALLLTIAQKSNIKYLLDTTVIYRVLSNSASHFLSWEKNLAFWNSVKNTRYYFAKRECFMFRVRLWFYNAKYLVALIPKRERLKHAKYILYTISSDIRKIIY